MESAHILATGAAVPSWRLPSAEVARAWGRGGGRGTAAVCAPDEDTLTLAWQAAGAALAAAGRSASELDAVFWGTANPPFAEGPSLAFLLTAIGAPADAGGVLTSGSAHAGMESLSAAIDAVAAGSARLALVVSSDAPLPGIGTPFEGRAGAGAAALLLGPAGPARVVARSTRSRPVLDRYRAGGEAGTRDVYDGRLFREQVFLPAVASVATALSDGAGSPAGAAGATADAGHVPTFDRWSLPDPDGRLGAAAARRVGARPDSVTSTEVYAALGDTGAAAPLLGVIPALAQPGSVGLIGYGSGRATGVRVEVLEPVPGAADLTALLSTGSEVSYAHVLRSRGQLEPLGETVAMGVPPEGAAFVRGIDEMLGLLGARCVDCGVISTPPSIHPACTGCGGGKLETVPLSREGTVHTFVINQTMPPPFVAPLPLAVIDLDDGARLMLQVASDGTGLEIGTRVRLVLRRYAFERGAPVYGYKALPEA